MFIKDSEMVSIGGILQYIQVTGNCDKPLLLFLHGGPGAPLSVITSKFPKELDDLFLVAHWDQRGCGKSYNENIPTETMNIEQLVLDTNEVIQYLLVKYQKEKLFLCGISWGSVLGITNAYRYPENLYAYIGFGQVIDSVKGEEISYNYLLKYVKKTKNEEAFNELIKIGNPPYKSIDDLMTQRKWLRQLGLSERKVSTNKYYGECCSNEEIEIIIKGVGFSEHLTSNIDDFNVYSITNFKVPVYFCMGKYDYQTPFILVKKYYNKIKAPKKKFIWFKESAHSTVFEEPNKFISVLKSIK